MITGCSTAYHSRLLMPSATRTFSENGEMSYWWSRMACERSVIDPHLTLREIAAEADVVLVEPREHDGKTAGLDHPLQAMIAVFALEQSLREHVCAPRHSGDRLPSLGQCL